MVYLQELQVTYGLAKFCAAAGAAKATTRATARTIFFMGNLLRENLGWELAAERGRVGVREGLGHGGRGKRDDQGDGDQKLLHFKSPLASWLALRGSGSGRMACVSVPNQPKIGKETPVRPIPYGYRTGAFVAQNSVGLSSPKPTGISLLGSFG